MIWATSTRKEIHGRLSQGKKIRALSVQEADRLIRFTREAYPEYLAVVTLGLFCGIRTEELMKLDWAVVRLEQGFVTISEEIAKKRRIRNVTLPDNAMEWILLIADRKGRVAPTTGKPFEHGLRTLRMKAGYKDKGGHSTWLKNGMRHSFGTYHYALHGDSAITSKELGHKQGDDELFDHYRALATKEQGEAYFAIKPGKAIEKVVKFRGVKA
jgi:integrase